MTEGVIQIADKTLVPGVIKRTEMQIEELERRSLAFTTSPEKADPYSLAQRSHKKERLRDLLLFAEYPHVSHVFDYALTGATNSNYGDRGVFNRQVEKLAGFLKKEEIFSSIHLTGNPPVVMAARYMSVHSATLRTLLYPGLIKDVVSINKPLTKKSTALGIVEDRMAELEKRLDGNGELITNLIAKLTDVLGPQRDLRGSRLYVSDPDLFDNALEKFSQLDGVFMRYVESHSTLEGWYQTSEEIDSKNLVEFPSQRLLERMAASIESDNPTLPYCSIHIIHEGKEYQLQLFDKEQAILKMDAATSRAMRKGGLRPAGFSKDEIATLANNSLSAIDQLSNGLDTLSKRHLHPIPAPVKV